MSTEKLAELTRKLVKNTSLGNVAWEETAQNDAYQAAFANYAVMISTQTNFEDRNDMDIVIQIFDSNGRQVEGFSDLDLRDFDPPADKNSFFVAMKEMHETARRQAIGADKAIDEIISELDDAVPF